MLSRMRDKLSKIDSRSERERERVKNFKVRIYGNDRSPGSTVTVIGVIVNSLTKGLKFVVTGVGNDLKYQARSWGFWEGVRIDRNIY